MARQFTYLRDASFSYVDRNGVKHTVSGKAGDQETFKGACDERDFVIGAIKAGKRFHDQKATVARVQAECANRPWAR